MRHDLQAVYEQAKEWVKEAGEQIRASFSETLMVDYKLNPSDLVTNMDKQTEQFLIKKINEHYPEHFILGEEGYGDTVETTDGTIWIIDPIDGTMNFVHLQRHFAISVGIYHDGIGVIGIIYDVVNDEMYHAVKGQGAYKNNEQLPLIGKTTVEQAVISMNAGWVVPNKKIDPQVLPPLVKALRGTRSFGSAAIEMAYVAAGFTDGYLTLALSPWDYAAGKILIEEVGGQTSRADGKPLNILERSSVFVAKPGLHEQVLSEYLLK